MPFVVLLLLAFMTPGLGGLSLPWGRRMAKTAWSSIRCVNASDPRQGRCFIRNAYIVDNVVWVVHPQRVEVPPLLCSAHDAPPEEARYCNVTWRSPKDFITRLHLPLRFGDAQKAVRARLLSFDSGIVFSRLNPNNMYHAVMEDSLPLFELILDTPELQDWLLPPRNTTSRLLFFQEGYHNCHPGTELAELLYPCVRLVEGPHNPAILYHVKFLVMGSRTSCVHAKHCQRGHFRTPELGALFRRFALRRAGLSGDARPPRRARARVTVVKRTAPATRQIANLGDTVAAVNSAIAAFYGPGARNATVVDFTPLGLREQMLAMLRTDILVMVHGGVYGNTLFLPRHAIVVDIYPYAFHPEQHGYHLNGIHLTLPTMHYGQLHLETNDSSTTLAVGEWCYSGPCSGINTTKPLHNALCLIVDASRLAYRVQQALLAWSAVESSTQPMPEAARAHAAAYAPPPSSATFLARRAAFERAAPAGLPSCDALRPCSPALLARFLAAGDCRPPPPPAPAPDP